MAFMAFKSHYTAIYGKNPAYCHERVTVGTYITIRMTTSSSRCFANKDMPCTEQTHAPRHVARGCGGRQLLGVNKSR
ncbi:hypothetical protein X777_04948 [Ooceraea biroi]|uniref:Uncharacterized protein n=1 Tax=Ooceraea biroi TaxID=2015173 RepID=A0A026WFG2_OOCBI|nr:hypothetical protein X777_04948 [Ooceraea biroi]